MKRNRNDGIIVLVAERKMIGTQFGKIFPGSQVSRVFKTEQGVAEWLRNIDAGLMGGPGTCLTKNGRGFQTAPKQVIGSGLCEEGDAVTRAQGRTNRANPALACSAKGIKRQVCVAVLFSTVPDRIACKYL